MGMTVLQYSVNTLLIFLAATFLLPVSAGAQDKITVERNDTTYYVHQVETGHTLYSISKLYGVEVETIQQQNPEVLAGLKVGQTLYIRVNDERAESPNEWTNPIRIEDGMMVHRVQRRETLYGISKQYNTDINRLLEINPGIENGINPGDELMIPPNDLDRPAAPIPQRDTTDVWMRHRVVKGETLYSIAKKYGVSQKALSSLNNDFPEGLKADAVIRIPLREEAPTVEQPLLDLKVPLKDTVALKERYNVVLMLPLHLGALDTTDIIEDPRARRLQEIAMSFYRGTLIALDSLRMFGAKIHLTLMDVSSDEDVQKALSATELSEAHLVIGPLQRKALEKVADFSAKRDIHLVCPVPQSNKILLASPNISKVHPSSDSEIRTMAKHVAEEHGNDNVVLINTQSLRDSRSVQLFKKYYHSATTERDSLRPPLKELECSSRFVGELGDQLDPSALNVLVVPAGDDSKSMIANLQSRIQLLDERYAVRLYALNEWTSYDFLDYSFKYRTSLTVPGPMFVDYTQTEVLSFLTGFRERFNSEPSNYAFLAYDVMLFYGKGLLQYGINFPNRFELIDQSSLLSIGFRFQKTGMDSGFENRHVYLLEHRNFALEPLKPTSFERAHR